MWSITERRGNTGELMRAAHAAAGDDVPGCLVMSSRSRTRPRWSRVPMMQSKRVVFRLRSADDAQQLPGSTAKLTRWSAGKPW
jgi:hypothetical protein